MCLKLGVIHPDYLLEQLTAKQLSEWEAFNVLQPVEGWREDWRYGMLASTMTNLALSIHKKKGHSPKYTTAIDFIPNYSGREEEKGNKQSTQEMKEILLNFAKSHNAKLKRDKIRTKPPKKRRK